MSIYAPCADILCTVYLTRLKRTNRKSLPTDGDPSDWVPTGHNMVPLPVYEKQRFVASS